MAGRVTDSGNHPELVEGWFDRLTMKTLSLPKGDRLTMIA